MELNAKSQYFAYRNAKDMVDYKYSKTCEIIISDKKTY